MPFSRIEKLLEILMKLGVNEITFGGGEPLLHPDILKILSLSKKKGFSIGVITNGSIMNETLAKSIVDNCDWIRFSISGNNEAVHDKIRSPGSFEKLCKSVKILNYYKGNSKLKVGCNCVIQNNNYQRLDKIIIKCISLQVDFLFFKVAHGMGQYQLSISQWKEVGSWLKKAVRQYNGIITNIQNLYYFFSSNIYDYKSLSQGYPVQKFYQENNIKCFVSIFHFTISAEGDIYPCCYLQYCNRSWNEKIMNQFKIGNIITESIDYVIGRIKCFFYDSIMEFPRRISQECGACTRFCLFNKTITDVYKEIINEK